MRLITTAFLAAALSTVLSCGSDKPTETEPEPSGPGTGSITAQVNGQPWSATTRSAKHAAGTLEITGRDAAQRTIFIGVANVSAPGTFQLGPGNPNGAIASVIEGAAIWSSPQQGGSGTLTVSIFTATRVKGSFTFTGLPATVSATGSREVIGGLFDLGK